MNKQIVNLIFILNFFKKLTQCTYVFEKKNYKFFKFLTNFFRITNLINFFFVLEMFLLTLICIKEFFYFCICFFLSIFSCF